LATVKAFGGDVDMLGNKIVDMTINDATEENQPVTLSQLDAKANDITSLISSNSVTVNNIYFRISSGSLQYSSDDETWYTLNQT